MGTLFLTSTGISYADVFEAFKKLTSEKKLHTAAIVTTAAEGKADNKYAKLAKQQLESLGFDVTYSDLEEQLDFDFTPFDTIYVCGGNTFKLLKYAKQADFGTSIKSLLDREGIYLGVSAGTLILSPTIDIANEVSPDPNDIRLSDLTAFNLVPFHMSVHYDDTQEAEVAAFEKRHDTTVKRLGNTQALIVSAENQIELLG